MVRVVNQKNGLSREKPEDLPAKGVEIKRLSFRDLGEDVSVAEAPEARCTRTAGRGTEPAALAQCLVDRGLTLIVKGQGLVGADLHAHAAAGAEGLVDLGHDTAHPRPRGTQEDSRFGGRRLALGNGLIDGFRAVCETTDEYPVRREFHRPEFRMGLHVEAVLVERDLEHSCDIRLLGRDDGRGQDEEVGIQRHFTVKDIIRELYSRPAAFFKIALDGFINNLAYQIERRPGIAHALDNA